MLQGFYAPAPFGRPPSVVFTPGSPDAMGSGGSSLWSPINTGATSAVWPTANLSLLYPFSVSAICTAVKMYLMNGSTASGNFDLGIYNDAGTLLVSKGSTAQSGTTAIQIVDTTDLALSPGVQYYAALVMDGIVGTTRCYTGITAIRLQSLGFCQVASNFPLATGITIAKPANAYLPMFGLSRLATF